MGAQQFYPDEGPAHGSMLNLLRSRSIRSPMPTSRLMSSQDEPKLPKRAIKRS
jgi:hypothetical protein